MDPSVRATAPAEGSSFFSGGTGKAGAGGTYT